MHMTQEADYAVRMVYCIATAGTRSDARFISEKMGITLRFSLKILGKLVSSGILLSFKGQGGGYELARRPSDISLNDVIETVDGPYLINRCLRDDHACSMDDATECYFRKIYADVSAEIQKKLGAVTFDRLLSGEQGLLTDE